jgi:hypothetical protein
VFGSDWPFGAKTYADVTRALTSLDAGDRRRIERDNIITRLPGLAKLSNEADATL